MMDAIVDAKNFDGHVSVSQQCHCMWQNPSGSCCQRFLAALKERNVTLNQSETILLGLCPDVRTLGIALDTGL